MTEPSQPFKTSARCPIRTTLELVGGKWKLPILYQLSIAELRFSELKKQIPEISEKMLIQELKVMNDSGLVQRNNFGEVPPRVNYAITEAGKLALPLIKSMADFANAYTQKVALA